MTIQPRGGRSDIHHHGNVPSKSGNRPWDTINTPLRVTLEYTQCTIGSPLVNALML
jgi:hypothetical protein